MDSLFSKQKLSLLGGTINRHVILPWLLHMLRLQASTGLKLVNSSILHRKYFKYLYKGLRECLVVKNTLSLKRT